MNYGDNQTKHFFVINNGDVVKINNLNGTDKFRVIITDNAGNGIATSDILSEKLILNKKMNTVMPIYYRKWTVNAMASVAADTTYYLYFYLENMLGFGMQDRWDRVAAYTAKSGDSVNAVMTALKEDLDLKLNGAGPIKNDFVVTMDGNNIVVKENSASNTYTWTKMDILTHGNPYVYNVTMSTYDGNAVWGGDTNKQIKAADTTEVRIKSGMKVFDMEQYFLRNRADMYSLTPDFNTSIINEPRTDVNKDYILFDIHYAFSDGLGFTYFSEKDLTLAVDAANTAALTELAKVFNVDNNANLESMGYIYDEATWRANYWRLADYFAAGNTANKDEWNGDGWLIFNFPAGKYAGKTISPKYDGDAMATVSATSSTSFAIYSTTNATDMGAATPVTGDTLADFDINKVEFAIA